jgi:two-component sensor histidine kinase
MNISFYDFKNLPDQTQKDIAINEGRVMNERVLNSLKYVLYEVSCFSVEVIYNIDNGKMEGLNVFQKAVYAT